MVSPLAASNIETFNLLANSGVWSHQGVCQKKCPTISSFGLSIIEREDSLQSKITPSTDKNTYKLYN